MFPSGAGAQDRIVINEIHYNPDVKTDRAEFVELFNAGSNTVNLAGWQLDLGPEYTFPATNLAPGGYVVVAQDPAVMATKFGFSGALGPFNPDRSSALSKYGDKVTLRNAAGDVVDEVEFQIGFPWPTVGDPPGYSIELINPNLDNNLGGNWRASSAAASGGSSNLLFAAGSPWKFLKGTNEASAPAIAWRALTFDDAAWPSGPAPIGYDPTLTMGTPLNDMRSNYVSVFFRKTFVVSDPVTVSTLRLEMLLDDGAKIWINTSNVLNENISSSELAFNGTANSALEDGSYRVFNLNNPASYLVPGTNIIAIQAHNVSLEGSSDFYLDVRLSALRGPTGNGPTPGRLNAVYAANAPPAIRQVEHKPEQPTNGQPVKVTAKVTDPDGVASVTLQYQIVNPGSYIALTNTLYTNAASWLTLPMNDAGTNGDATAGDDVYTAEIPASVQQHRRLIRYRITVADGAGLSVRVPYADDPQPNFAYFCYNGVPEWRGAVQPGAGGVNGVVQTFSNSVMGRLPVIHLIGESNTVATATWFSRYGGDLYQWVGTLVYDGKVYDHIHYRARGGVWRYSMVKNMWKFDFNRGHDFVMRDNWGRKFKTGWTKLNLGASIQQGDYDHRGEQGMFESLGFRMFQLAGVAAPNTTFVTFRVIDDALEAAPGTQYEGDFWGVYLAIEQEDGRFLEEHDLPDSNLYKMEGGTGELNNLSPWGPTDKSDLNAVLPQNNVGRAESWWRTNWNLPKYYSYQAIVQGIHHYDICYDKNFFYFTNSATRLWEVCTWDLDLTWADNMFDAGCGGKDRVYQRVFDETSPAKPQLMLEWRNRIREVRDLFFNSDEAWRLIEEYAALLRGPTNGPTILDADRSMWDYNPKMISSTYTPNLNKAGQGRFYAWPQASESFASKNFNGCLQILKAYVNRRGSNTLDVFARDDAKPLRPTVTYTGPSNYPINRLTFRVSNYTSPSNYAFASVKWRLGEISTNPPSWTNTEPLQYEIEARWEATNTTFVADVTIPPAAVRVGSRYRVRAQFTDATGRWSQWSLPHEFTCGESENLADLLNYLRITEIMFNPPPGGYEYIELHNSSSSLTLDLSGVKFTQGVDFTCGTGVTIPPGGYLLVIGTTNIAAFRAYYGLDASVPILAAFSGNLNNGGEQLTLRTAAGGTDIISFDYRDGRGWPVAADGAGASLVLLDSAEAQQRSTSGDSGTGEYGGNWRMSTYLRGSPGRADAPPPTTIVLNEIATHTDFLNELDSNDWIELFNTMETNVALGPGWFLSDDGSDLMKWQIPSNTVIAARGWVSFDEQTGFHNPTNIGFGLSKDGEQVFLSYLPGGGTGAVDRIVDAVSFKAQENDWSWGRYPDGAPWWYALEPRTRDSTNAAPPLRLVISEINYHPADSTGTNDNTRDEFVEIWNPTLNPVPLFNTNGPWRLDGVAGDGNFNFPSNLTLGGGKFLLLVNFDPADAAQSNAFRATYGISDPDLRFCGPYAGKLANNSGRVALERPQSSDPPGSGISWVIVDEVIYADLPPWPCGSDETGNSLQRVDALAHGSDPANWNAQTPTPGAPRVPGPAGLPTITTPPASRIVATNASVSFSVSVCGTPPFTYQWRHEGTNLPGATNAVLVRNNVQAADAGQYTVLVTNPAGTVESEPATLIVQFPPVILAHPAPVTAVRGQTATFTVSAGGTAPLQFQWTHNGANLNAPGAATAALVLTNVQATNAGTYRVTVFNAAGSAQSDPATLTVLIPATITNPPASQTVSNGANVTFTVGATGTGTLLYQWQFLPAGAAGAPTNLPGATNATLARSNVQLADAGTYRVIVTDDIGSDLASATLTVLMRPVITQQPQPALLVVPVGANASFTVAAQGTLPLSFRWRKGGTTLTNIILNSTTCTFTLYNVQTNVTATNGPGNYNVVITNIAGSASGVSSNATLSVLVPPVITLQPTHQTAEAGSNATFTAAAGGSAPRSYQWYLNDTNAIAGATNNTHTVTNAGPADHGAYTFVASNPVGAATSQVATLTLLIPPLVVRQPVSQTVNVGADVVFSVGAIGATPLFYQWKFYGTNLLAATNATLTLSNVQATHAGPYTVAVSNALGDALSDPATLTVLKADRDGDGILDDWESAYGLDPDDPTDATRDADSDRMTNLEEFMAGTNPTNALSYLKIETILREPGADGLVRLTFLAMSNKTYSVLCGDGLATDLWNAISNVAAAPSNREIEVTNAPPTNAPQRYYRLVTPQRDSP